MIENVLKIIIPLIIVDILFRRLPYAKYDVPSHTHKLSSFIASSIIKPGDVLICKGNSADSSAVNAWSISEYSHVAVIGADRMVYDVTPIEHERRKSLEEYVEEYEGYVVLRIKREPQKVWYHVPKVEFRESLIPLLGATCSENPLRHFFGLFVSTYQSSLMFCSEYVCTSMGLDNPSISHPMNFAPKNKFSSLYYDDLVLLY